MKRDTRSSRENVIIKYSQYNTKQVVYYSPTEKYSEIYYSTTEISRKKHIIYFLFDFIITGSLVMVTLTINKLFNIYTASHWSKISQQ